MGDQALLEKLKSSQQSGKLYVSDPATFLSKVRKLIADGVNNLMVITDFDHTLSRYLLNGEKCWTTHGVLESALKGAGGNELYERSLALKEKYTPIEYCPEMSVVEKIPYMIQWWDESHSITVAGRIRKSDLARYCREADVHLREGASELIRSLDSRGVPVLVFSAGVKDIIEAITTTDESQEKLQQEMGSVPPSVHVISNRMNFDDEGLCIGFTPPLIHTFNKNSSVIRQEEPFYEKISHRSVNNVVLMGDHLGDIHMDVGVEKEGAVLRIGFLNFNFEQLLGRYMEAYDLVLVNDQTMDVPLALWHHILSNDTGGGSICK